MRTLGLSLSTFILLPLAAQEDSRKLIQTAMRTELDRSRQQLSLPGLQKPAFLAFRLRDQRSWHIQASGGALLSSWDKRQRIPGVQILVGDYALNNSNFFDLGASYARFRWSSGTPAPLEEDLTVLRTAFWQLADDQYKEAAEARERKVASLKQQKLPEEWAQVPDLSKAPTQSFTQPARSLDLDRKHWEGVLKELSAEFLRFPEIQTSSLSLGAVQGEFYLCTSEGTDAIQPQNIVNLSVNLSTQAPDGRSLRDVLNYCALSPQELPAKEELSQTIQKAAKRLTEMRQAPLFEGSYSGPVLFEDEAVAELFIQRFFSPRSEGLLALRPIITGDMHSRSMVGKPKTLEERLETRILPKGFLLSGRPGMERFEGKPLVGSFQVDGMGVKPPQNINIVEDGILKHLLSGRTPTPKCPVSNGHERWVLGQGVPQTALGPGVLELQAASSTDLSQMKSELLRLAKESGLKQAYLIRKLARPDLNRDAEGAIFETPSSQAPGEEAPAVPLALYRVSVADGKEELVRNAELSGLSLSAFKHIMATSSQREAYNVLLPPLFTHPMAGFSMFNERGIPSGIPVSLILPKAILFEELELRKSKPSSIPAPPVVPSPIR